jgi:hypothetical protein
MIYSISEWGCIIDGAQDKRKDLFDLITKDIEKRDPPETKWDFKQISTKGIFVFLSLKKREFLVITSKATKGYELHVCADPFGNALAVHAGLVTYREPTEWYNKKISWEDSTIVSDWTSIIFRSIQDSCRVVLESLGQSPERMKAETKGILSVW